MTVCIDTPSDVVGRWKNLKIKNLFLFLLLLLFMAAASFRITAEWQNIAGLGGKACLFLYYLFFFPSTDVIFCFFPTVFFSHCFSFVFFSLKLARSKTQFFFQRAPSAPGFFHPKKKLGWGKKHVFLYCFLSLAKKKHVFFLNKKNMFFLKPNPGTLVMIFFLHSKNIHLHEQINMPTTSI